MNKEIIDAVKNIGSKSGNIIVLTGAGISAESNIPTFRGPEGYWTIGSKEYHPQEMATFAMFSKKPDEVWKWYLYRMNVCGIAEPNPGHHALVEMEKIFGNRFTLVTQNVDGLHLKAGSSHEKTYQIHGNIFYMRCSAECSGNLYSVPAVFQGRPKDVDIEESERQLLTCPECGKKTRPHVLWFDEVYNEKFFKFNSSLKAASKTKLLIIVGTSGTTNLPNQIAWEVSRHKGLIIDINIEKNPFSELALRSNGFFIREKSSVALPELLDILKK